MEQHVDDASKARKERRLKIWNVFSPGKTPRIDLMRRGVRHGRPPNPTKPLMESVSVATFHDVVMRGPEAEPYDEIGLQTR